MKLNSGPGLLRLFTSSILDQVVLSGANFIVTFLMIRFSNDRDYGIYALTQSALVLISSSQTAWLTVPLATLAPGMAPEARRETISSIRDSQRRFLLLGLAVPLPAAVLAALFFPAHLQTSLIVFTAVVAGWAVLRRDYLRSLLLIYSRPHSLLMVDIIYSSILVAGVALAVVVRGNMVILAISTIALAAYACGTMAHRSLARDPGWVAAAVTTVWPKIRALGNWSLLGATIYWFLGISYSSLLAMRLGLHAVADVNAMRAVMNPALILTSGVIALLMPISAKWYSQIGLRRLSQRLLLVVCALVTAEFTYFLIVWKERGWIVGDFLHKTIAQRDELLLLWAGVALVSILRDVMQCALTATQQYKSLAGQVAISAAVAVALMWYGMGHWGEGAVLIGQLVGETINIAGIIWLLRKLLKVEAGDPPTSAFGKTRTARP
jgi:O-antigen/teichoic acid export membrane protein